MIENISSQFHVLLKEDPLRPVRTLWIGNEAGEFVLMEDTGSEEFIDDKFCLNLQALGEDVRSIYVEELGTTLSRKEMYKILVIDLMAGIIEVDWRDFFPYLKWKQSI